ncbi:MAG: DNA mismatch repair protein MutS [Oscillospiraceae bacterium]|nr:DNA mismatch repair protein MutS [Oscillospiraceae bacterium]
MAELTPMMQQYLQIKEQNQDAILFFRLGDFYEMFADDARVASRELDLTLTTRDKAKDKEDRIPMCGIPYHSSESYIARLVSRGYKVAICEQVEDPATAKGLVKRDIVRTVTPGTVTESSMLDEKKNNYFACVAECKGAIGLAFCDISTGGFFVTHAVGEDAVTSAQGELGRFSPAEAVVSCEQGSELFTFLQEKLSCCTQTGEKSLFAEDACREALEKQFLVPCEEYSLTSSAAIVAAGALLKTLQSIQKNTLSHLTRPEFYTSGQFMVLDLAARRNLELTETLRRGEKKGSLLWVLDKTRSSAGSRLMRSFMEKPLLSVRAIRGRLSAVEELTQKTLLRDELREELGSLCDLERIVSRMVTGTANARDLAAFVQGTEILPKLKEDLSSLSSPLLTATAKDFDDLSDLRHAIACAVVDEPPLSVREGGMIRKGYHEELDRLREIQDGGKNILLQMEKDEREKTGIKTLKMGYNRVFGYYIEVSKGQTAEVPEHYIRKQTLVNGERYITQELKELENTIMGAKDRIVQLEYDIFTKLRNLLASHAPRIQSTARAAALADVLSTFAHVAVKNRYTCPEVDESGIIQIQDGRHPVVEQVLKDELFVPNDTLLDTEQCRAALITGPNMAGKSTYMRQVALITLMAQMGSFVPARDARIGVVDRIFTRIGASDDLSSGQSTFMVEMTEVADILRYATNRSLLILDEIGRGTSTFDGMAIARAVLEFAVDQKKLGAKTLFATHYHELTEMEQELQGLQNFNIAVKKRQGDMIFLRKIVKGPATSSYGVEVAKLAGLPDSVLTRARNILQTLESGAVPAPRPAVQEEAQVSMGDMTANEILKRVEQVSLDTLTPIEAMNLLYELKKLL